MNVRFLLLSALFVSFLPPLAHAENKPNALTFTMGGGYIFFSPKRDLQNTDVPGMAALTYNFTEKWALDFAANLINANSSDPSKHYVHGFIYLLDSLYRLPAFHIFEPYLLAGANVTSLKPIASEPVNQGGVNIGIGTQFFRAKAIALSVEAREVYTFSGGKGDTLLNGGINFIWD